MHNSPLPRTRLRYSKSISSHVPDEVLDSLFYSSRRRKRTSRAPGSSFSPEFGPLSIRRAQAIPAPPGHARGLRRKQMCGKHRGKFLRVWWPRLVVEKGRSSSSSHRLPRAVKACRRRTCSHAVRRVNAHSPIYRGLPCVWPHSPPSPQSTLQRNLSSNGGLWLRRQRGQQWLRPRSLHQWEGRLLYMAGYPAPSDFRAPGG
jgi:hypothetical protein